MKISIAGIRTDGGTQPRAQIDWAMYLMGGEPGSELNRPKQFWRDSKGRVRRADRPKAGRATMRRDGESWATGVWRELGL